MEGRDATMYSAAFDSSHGLAFAVADDQRLLIDAHQAARGRGTETAFVQWIRDLLAQSGISLPEIARWTVGTGPGSFTGIRLGIGFVKGVCLQTCAAYRGVPSSMALAAAAADVLKPGQTVAILNDARRGELILSPYRKTDNDGLLRLADPRIVRAADVHPECGQFTRLVTVQADAVTPLLPASLQARLQCDAHVAASRLLDIQNVEWPRTPAEQEESCEPIYVRPAVFVKPRTPKPPVVD